MEKQKGCTECVEREWENERIWWIRLAQAIHIPPHEVKYWALAIVTIYQLLARTAWPISNQLINVFALWLLFLVALRVPTFIRRHIIGRYFYLFKCQDEESIHLHRKLPWRRVQDRGLYGRRLLVGALRLPQGGLLRWKKVVWKSHGHWKEVIRYGRLFRVRDETGNELVEKSEWILSFISRFSDVFAPFRALDQLEQRLKEADTAAIDTRLRERRLSSQLQEMTERWHELHNRCGTLGHGICAVIHYLQESKDRQRSKVGQQARQLLEEIIDHSAREQREGWMAQADAELRVLTQRLAERENPRFGT